MMQASPQNMKMTAHKPPSAACGRHLPPEGGFFRGSLLEAP
jgi:hypothetical protein